MYFEWSEQKNRLLKKVRGVGFEDVLNAIDAGNCVDVIEHWNMAKYSNQRVLIVVIKDYTYAVPYVNDGTKLFLKTIFPDRRLHKFYSTRK